MCVECPFPIGEAKIRSNLQGQNTKGTHTCVESLFSVGEIDPSEKFPRFRKAPKSSGKSPNGSGRGSRSIRSSRRRSSRRNNGCTSFKVPASPLVRTLRKPTNSKKTWPLPGKSSKPVRQYSLPASSSICSVLASSRKVPFRCAKAGERHQSPRSAPSLCVVRPYGSGIAVPEIRIPRIIPGDFYVLES